MNELERGYQEYMATWAERFGDSDSGEVSYTYRDIKVHVPVRRMTPSEFTVAVQELSKLRLRQHEAEEQGDIEVLRKTHAESFVYELILLY